MKLIYIGRSFYRESGTMMSSIYTEDGRRMDWGLIECALGKGESIDIRPATEEEIEVLEDRLSDIKRRSRVNSMIVDNGFKGNSQPF